MGAVLVGTDGPSRGRLVPLGAGEVSLGRHESNSVPLNDVAASKQHCIIRRSGEQFQLVDTKSRNGTFVNGLLVRERILEDNDEIRVGGSVFLFRREHKEDPKFTTIHSSETIYLNHLRLDETLPPMDRTAHGVHILLRISQTLQVSQTVDELKQHLIQLLFEAVPAECGCIILENAPEKEAAFILKRGSEARVGEVPAIDAEVSRRAREERRAVLKRDDALPLIAAPLLCFDRMEGLLYLRGGADFAPFDNGDLELVSAVGAIAGMAIRNLLTREDLRQEKERLEEEIRIEHDMVGDSPEMHSIHRFISKVAPKDSTVLIGGESGTGKELVARAIHQNSSRVNKPFVAINCAALAENLLESEFFGHEKGAFTDASVMKKGMFEVADGGTLFLDEIGELAPGLQAKLLRAIETQKFTRVGGTREISVNVRIVAATNRDLAACVDSKTFRQDLYSRLNVISVTLPPLRDHRKDIHPLVTHFIKKFNETMKRNVKGISDKALAALVKYDWEGGNVRELRNTVEHAMVMGTSDTILPEDLPESVLETATATRSGVTSSSGTYQDAVVAFKRQKVSEALARANGTITEAAKLLDVHPNYLHRLMKNLQVEKLGREFREVAR
jgi:Nif-specific regulatory protein